MMVPDVISHHDRIIDHQAERDRDTRQRGERRRGRVHELDGESDDYRYGLCLAGCGGLRLGCQLAEGL